MGFLDFFNKHGMLGTNFAYDEDENQVECDVCGQPLVFRNGEYYCPECDEVWSREKFFDFIGADLPGTECYSCDNDYPSCTICQYGYIDDDEDEY